MKGSLVTHLHGMLSHPSQLSSTVTARVLGNTHACYGRTCKMIYADCLLCSWLETSLLALERQPADTCRADEAQHSLDVLGAAYEAGRVVNYR